MTNISLSFPIASAWTAVRVRPIVRDRAHAVSIVSIALLASVACFLATVVGAPLAKAETPSVPPYGELSRFPKEAGPDTKALFNESSTVAGSLTTETSLTSGKFVYPVGMGVDTDDPSTPEKYAIYVLDLVNPQMWDSREIYKNAFANLELQYRLQKLNVSGAVLATRIFTLESTASDPGLHAVSLAVDGPAHRVYVLTADAPPTAENSGPGSYAADRIDAWTTGTGSAAGEAPLSPAADMPEDELQPDPLEKEAGEGPGHPKAGELAGPDAAHRLQTGAASLAGDVEPESLAVDGTGEGADLALAGNEYTTSPESIAPVIEALVTLGDEAGALDGKKPVWHEAAKTEDKAAVRVGQSSQALYSASANPDGSLNVSLGPAVSSPAALNPAESEPNMARVGEDLKETTPLLPSENVGEGSAVNYDSAATDGFAQDLPGDKYSDFGQSGATPFVGSLAPTVVQLAGGGSSQFPDGLYAGLVAQRAEQDSQHADGELYSWRTALTEKEEEDEETVRKIIEPASLGIRIFDSNGDSLGMIGNVTPGGPCNLQGGFNERVTSQRGSFAALASGREGVVFALVQPDLEKVRGSLSITPATPLDAGEADQVVEFEPNDKTTGQECPQPAGDFSITNESVTKPAASKGSGPLTVPAGSKLKFDAGEVELRGGSPWAYEWDLENGEQAGISSFPWTLNNEFTLTPGQGEGWIWPSPMVEHTYSTPGEYTAKLTLVNDFGTFTAQRTVIVEPTEEPVAKFTVSQPQEVGKPVTLDASASTVPAHDSIVNYHWEFEGEGGESKKEGEPTTQHLFATAGSHKITLKINDSFHKKAEVSETIEVVEEEKTSGGGTSTTPTATTPTTTTPATVIPPASTITLPLKTSLPPAKSQVLTDKQKLTNALKACHKLKGAKRRASCEKQAKKKYDSKPKASKKKK
jgi:PKD repeat protein